MTGNEPRSDRNGKRVEAIPPWDDYDPPLERVEIVRPWDDYDPYLDAYSSWLLAIEWLHDRMVAELIADHDNRMPENWQC